MKRDVGVWIDHRKAVIVTIENENEETREIRSNMEKHVSDSDGDYEKSSMDSPGSHTEVMQNQKLKNHLGRYYKALVTLIRDADSIWLFGPVEAKE